MINCQYDSHKYLSELDKNPKYTFQKEAHLPLSRQLCHRIDIKIAADTKRKNCNIQKLVIAFEKYFDITSSPYFISNTTSSNIMHF